MASMNRLLSPVRVTVPTMMPAAAVATAMGAMFLAPGYEALQYLADAQGQTLQCRISE